MLKRAVAVDVDWIVAFETAVMNKKLNEKPLDHPAARSEIETNEYYVQFSNGRVIATDAASWAGATDAPLFPLFAWN